MIAVTDFLPVPQQVADLTAEEARALTDEIRDDVSMLLPKIREAYARHADAALGYAGWEEYCRGELSSLRLPMPERREISRALKADGMSARAISAAMGVDHETINKDLRSSPAGEKSPPEEVRQAKDDEIRQLLAEGKGYKKIKAELHTSEERISRVIKEDRAQKALEEDGVGLPAGIDSKIYEDAQRNKRILEYAERGMKVAAISDEMGIAQSTVRRVLSRQVSEGIVKDSAGIAERRMKLADMASKGYTSEQIASALGYSSAVTLKDSAANWGIEIPADAVVGRTRKLYDSTKILQETADQLDGLFMAVSYVDFDKVDLTEIGETIKSMEESRTQLSRLIKRLKGLIV